MPNLREAMSEKLSFFPELKRRNVCKVAVAATRPMESCLS
jgi:hypothetical protein